MRTISLVHGPPASTQDLGKLLTWGHFFTKLQGIPSLLRESLQINRTHLQPNAFNSLNGCFLVGRRPGLFFSWVKSESLAEESPSRPAHDDLDCAPPPFQSFLTPRRLQVVEDYISSHWHETVRSCVLDEGTLLGLPFPYTVPCCKGAFQEIYYWDTCFTCLGLIQNSRTDLAAFNTRNLLSQIQRFGLVPNGNRTAGAFMALLRDGAGS
jgi:hypothetical protein